MEQFFSPTKPLYIGLDFDGTMVTHEYPLIGKDIGAIPILKELVGRGHKLILNTMRSRIELMEAADWFAKNEITLSGINKNPTQENWTISPKVYAHIYIDDAALGCPLKNDPGISDRPFVDWDGVKELLIQRNIL